MSQPILPLLVLAWDDADASPYLPGEEPAPPTLPLLRALAARRALLAVLPQLPEAVRSESRLAEIAQASAAKQAAEQQAGGPDKAFLPATESASFPDEPVPPAASGAKEPALLISEALPMPDEPASRLANPARAAGVPLLPAGAGAGTTPPVSRIIGLAEVGFTTQAAPAQTDTQLQQRPESAPVLPPAAAPFSPFVWPAVPRISVGQAPAAPYAGSTTTAPAPPYPSVPPPPAPPATDRAGARPPADTLLHSPQHVSDLAFDPDPELPLLRQAPVPAFAASSEPGPAEAAAIHAPANNLTLSPAEAGMPASAQPGPAPALPPAYERATLTQALASLSWPAEAAPAPAAPALDAAASETAAVESPPAKLSDDLHYRIIQYARFATHAATEYHDELGVIYAPNWPTWLAALEIRYRLKRPLVLHLTALARDTATPANRGWPLEIERYALRRAHTVLVTSEDLRRRVLAHYSLPPERVQVLAFTDEAGIAAALAELS